MALGENIKKARKAAGLSQQQLADAINNESKKAAEYRQKQLKDTTSNDYETFGNTAISNWENGKSKPDADTIMYICKALGVDANYMLDWEETKASYDIKEKLHLALKENKFFDGEDLTEENFNKLMDFIERNKDFIIDKKADKK